MSTAAAALETCPRCGMDLTQGRAGRRICSACGGTIGSHHKWFFGEDGRPRHRHCDNPYAYVSRADEDAMKGQSTR